MAERTATSTDERSLQPDVPKAPPDSGLVGADGTFASGSTVALAGLQGQQELNGRLGVVQGYSEPKGRYRVAVEGRERAANVKPENVYIPAINDGKDRRSQSKDFVVDVGPFMPGSSATQAEQWMASASWDATFREVGFARIVGHGVSAEVVAGLRAAASAFFAQPEAAKLQYHHPPGSTVSVHNGSYSPLWSAKKLGLHDDPVEGYTFRRPPNGECNYACISLSSVSASLPTRASLRTIHS
eukprot:SAG31_NODE_1641_length_7664_cov_3.789954_6_plen_242_part_00